jgi:UDP-N-acetylglucosamine 2-epimerase (non-hydrolysing)
MSARLKVLVAVGTRPEAIKMVPVIRALEASKLLKPWVVSTGQHPELVASVLALGGIEADVVLDLPMENRTLNEMFAGIVSGLEQALVDHFGPPDSVMQSGRETRYPAMGLVHGDTTSAAAAALCAFHLRMPIGHVEAGLRTHLTHSPFPEELNRQLISRIASFHLAPTAESGVNLIREGVPHYAIFVTGNTAIDAIQWSASLNAPYWASELDDLDEDPRPVVVVTAHRRENWGDGILRIAAAVAELATLRPGVRFVLPLHPNPAVAGPLTEALSGFDNVDLVPAMDYASFARLLRRARFAISDSGGIQEEAPAVGTPVLVTRETTERQEAVTAGTVRLVGTDPDKIVRNALELLDDEAAYRKMVDARNPFGDGLAAERIVQALDHFAGAPTAPARFGAAYSKEDIFRSAGMSEGIIEMARAREGRGVLPPEPQLPPESVTTPVIHHAE